MQASKFSSKRLIWHRHIPEQSRQMTNKQSHVQTTSHSTVWGYDFDIHTRVIFLHPRRLFVCWQPKPTSKPQHPTHPEPLVQSEVSRGK
jgi:hypothetical protein